MVIQMYYDDHPTPHIHVRYSESRCKIDLAGNLLGGNIPLPKLHIVIRWIKLHHKELMENWKKVRMGIQPKRIDPWVWELAKKWFIIRLMRHISGIFNCSSNSRTANWESLISVIIKIEILGILRIWKMKVISRPSSSKMAIFNGLMVGMLPRIIFMTSVYPLKLIH